MKRSTIAFIGFSVLSANAVAHEGHGDELPWQACSALSKNDACEYSNSHGDLYKGHCKLFNEALMCVRNQPIIKTTVVSESLEEIHFQAKGDSK